MRIPEQQRKKLAIKRPGSTFVNMTEGNPVRLILKFALPLVVGNLFQQLYSLVDAAVIGNFIGVAGFAAVSCTGWIIWTINATSRDLSNAFCIAGSIRIGRKDTDGFRRIVTQGYLFCGVVVAVFLAFVFFGMDIILHFLNVPAEIYEQAKTYLSLIVLAMPLGVSFHLTAGLLRAAGNSDVTFYAMVASTVVNIALDLLFVVVLHWSVAGAAIATIIAQGCSLTIALLTSRNSELFRFQRTDWGIDIKIVKEIVKLWIPMAMNSVVLAVGGIYVSRRINAIGTYFTAGTEASGTIFTVLEAIIMAVQTGANVFVGQNFGAKKAKRIYQGMHRIILAAEGLTLLLIGVVWLSADGLVSFFMSSADPLLYQAAHEVGVQSTKVFISCMVIMTPMYFYRSALQTLGHPEFAVYGAFLQVGARIGTVTLLPAVLGVYAYYIPTAVAWLFTLPVVVIPYYHFLKRLLAEEQSVTLNGL